MIIVRFRVRCQTEKTEPLRKAFEAVVAPSRAVEGVLAFDIAQDITDSNVFIATEIFKDRAALQRQEALPEVKNVMALLPSVLVANPEATIYTVSSTEPWG